LVEVMVASAALLLIFAGASYAAVQLHRRGAFEENVADTQEVARSARELFAPRIERAGSGMANLTVTVGKDGLGNADVRTSFAVRTNVVFPSAAYPSLISDAVDLYWAEPTTLMLPDLVACGGGSARSGDDLCVVRLPGGSTELQAGDYVLAANVDPTIATSCLLQVAGVDPPGLPGRIHLTSGAVANDAALDLYSPCTTANAGQAFWKSNKLRILKMGGASFRIDWSTPTPRLQYDPDGWWAAGAGWMNVANNVEQMQVRVGLVSLDLLNPPVPSPLAVPASPPPVLWFPEPSALPTARPSLDACGVGIASCLLTAVAGSNSDPNFPDQLRAPDIQLGNVVRGPAVGSDSLLRSQLMRRARMVELKLSVRSSRQDLTQVQMSGSAYALDPVGNPLDGRTRRHYQMRVSLRNYGYAGL
jgi:hypothetical protein